jgi:hypothetical protein
MKRESDTIAVLVRLYCHDIHRSDGICPECQELLEYAWTRLDKCPYQEGKTTCAKCPVHCYKPEMRARIRVVMRYSGPRVLFRNPILAIPHMIDGLRKKPVSGQKN